MEVDVGKRWTVELNSENAGQNGPHENFLFSSNISDIAYI